MTYNKACVGTPIIHKSDYTMPTTFMRSLVNFHVISRFRNDVILYYPTLEQKTGKRGHPKWFDGRIDFANLDLTRCKEYEVNKGK